MELLFDQLRVPRTTTRDEWRATKREVRITRKRLAASNAERLALVPQLLARGDAHARRLVADILDKAIYPPLMLGPFQDFLVFPVQEAEKAGGVFVL
jgi:hypothetical protein